MTNFQINNRLNDNDLYFGKEVYCYRIKLFLQGEEFGVVFTVCISPQLSLLITWPCCLCSIFTGS